MSIKFFILVSSLLALGGCGRTHEARMVHPQTNATADCIAHGAGFIDRITATAELNDCIKKYEAQGYVRQEPEGS